MIYIMLLMHGLTFDVFCIYARTYSTHADSLVPGMRWLVAETKLVLDPHFGAPASDALEDILAEVEEERLLVLPQAALLDVDGGLTGAQLFQRLYSLRLKHVTAT